MDKKRLQILASVSELYIKYGIKSVTMDDVARSLSISKKTLYQYVNDKEDLVRQVVGFHIQSYTNEFNIISQQVGFNAIDILWLSGQHLITFLSSINTIVRDDLAKYYPAILKIFDEHKYKQVYVNIVENIKQGQGEGLYREDINPDIIAKMYVSRIEIMFDGELFPSQNYTYSAVFSELFKYHIYGIASKQGIQYYETKMDD